MDRRKTLILDNGGGSIKAGFVDDDIPITITNATAKVPKSMQYLVGEQIDKCQNGSLLQFTRPFERGYLTNWQCEIEVWNHLLQTTHRCIPQEVSLVLTESPLNPATVQNDLNELIFEYYGFKEYLRRPSIWFSANRTVKNCEINADRINGCTIIDSGFSFTHVAPFLNGRCQRHAVSILFSSIVNLTYLR
jgi:actin-related protein 6